MNKIIISDEMRFRLYLMRLEIEVAFMEMGNACKKACDSFKDFSRAMSKVKGNMK